MQSQQQLRDELQLVSDFSNLFDLMQQVAISRLRRMEEEQAHRPSLTDILASDCLPLLPKSSKRHELIKGGRGGGLIVVITSDEGFVGPLHSGVMREAMERADEATQWILVGHRGLRFLGARVKSKEVIPMPSSESANEAMRRLGQAVVERYTREALRGAWLASPEFVSTFRQRVRLRQLLPIPITRRIEDANRQDLIVEPSLDRVIESLSLFWVKANCTEAYWSARRAEYAARALYVESSRQDLNRHRKMLRYEFFKATHERIDALVRETCVVQRHMVGRKAG